MVSRRVSGKPVKNRYRSGSAPSGAGASGMVSTGVSRFCRRRMVWHSFTRMRVTQGFQRVSSRSSPRLRQAFSMADCTASSRSA